MKTKVISTFIGICVLLMLAPWGMLALINHGSFTVPPEFMDDSGYYYARMQAVADGHPFIGNPYFKEHADAMASAFFGADWIASIPLFLHVPLLPAALLNLALSTALFVTLSLMLLRLLGLSSRWQMAGALALLVTGYWLLLRPVAMQVVFPSFLFFLVGYLAWLQNPASKKRLALFVVSSALTFYLYTYLWQIVTIVIGLTHILFLTPSRRRYLSLIVADIAITILIAPIIWYTYLQLQNPDYWETVTRIGYIATHTFGSAAVLNLALIVLAFVLLLAAGHRALTRPSIIFFTVTGAALVIASFSNMLTGKDLETAVHMARFVEVWAALTVSYAAFLYIERKGSDNADALPITICVLLGVLLIGNLTTVYDRTDEYLRGETYRDVLVWLNENTPAHSVVLADDRLSYYIPVATHDFVLFQPDGGLYLVPNTEVENRYLASRLFSEVTEEQLKNDFRLYAGVGNAVHHYKVANRESSLCRALHFDGCAASFADGVDDRGEEYFQELYARYQAMQRAPRETLAAYGVDYVILPITQEPPLDMKPAAVIHGLAVYALR